MPSTGNRYHHQHLASSASSSSDPIPQWQTLGQVRLRHRWSAGPSLQTMGLFGPDCFRSITRPTAASVFATLRATASNVLVLYHCREKESQLAATVQANNSRGDSLGTPTAPIHTHTHASDGQSALTQDAPLTKAVQSVLDSLSIYELLSSLQVATEKEKRENSELFLGKIRYPAGRSLFMVCRFMAATSCPPHGLLPSLQSSNP